MKPYCLACGKEMKHNVPRLGPAGGWVHSDTGYPLCGPRPEIKWVYHGTPPTDQEIIDKALSRQIQTEKESHHYE